MSRLAAEDRTSTRYRHIGVQLTQAQRFAGYRVKLLESPAYSLMGEDAASSRRQSVLLAG
jgi:hypothetical protein